MLEDVKAADKEQLKEAIERESAVLAAHLEEARAAQGDDLGAEGAFGPFSISEKTKQTIEILEDVPYSYEDWIEENVQKDSWSTKILKFWFLFSKKHN